MRQGDTVRVRGEARAILWQNADLKSGEFCRVRLQTTSVVQAMNDEVIITRVTGTTVPFRVVAA